MERARSTGAMRTTRAASARRHIEAAVTMLHAGQLDCAVSLAAAGEGLLVGRVPTPYLDQLLDRVEPAGPHFDAREWLQSFREPSAVDVSELDAAIVLLRAVATFIATCGHSSRAFDDFWDWANVTYPALRSRGRPAG